ncbi:MAG: nucleoside 2-deoxyribosyltransferase [Candidatus Neomarinimicrobiota bacterium]
MRIYFSGSMSGGRERAHLYPHIIDQLRKYGEVLTEFVADQRHSQMGERDVTPEAVYRRDTDFVNRCDVMVAEVSVPSFGVGVEVAHAGMQGKPVLALYQPSAGRRLSAMIAGDPNVTVAEYHSLEEAKKAVEEFFGALGVLSIDD